MSTIAETERGTEPLAASLRLPDGSTLELRLHGAERTAGGDDPSQALCEALDAARAVFAPDPVEAGEPLDGERDRYLDIVGRSPPMRRLFTLLRKVAPSDASVLITGENGTGKELVARAIHRASPRASGPFIATNCSAFNDNLLESELFGHKKGSFTGAVADKKGLFEVADGGTFLLDEVGDMSPALQVKLLRVLQEGTFTPVGGTGTKKVDVRIVAATNRDLASMVSKGTFREDLYYRLHVVALHTPPLRERKGDLDLLIRFFMERLSQRHGQTKRLAPQTLAKLRGHTWPGNVRELQNEIERLWVLAGDETVIGPEHLSASIARATPVKSVPPGTSDTVLAPASEAPAAPAASSAAIEPLADALERVERELISKALAASSGNRTHAAQALGISRRNLIRKLQAYGLD